MYLSSRTIRHLIRSSPCYKSPPARLSFSNPARPFFPASAHTPHSYHGLCKVPPRLYSSCLLSSSRVRPLFYSLYCSSTNAGFRQPLGFYGVFHHQVILGHSAPADYQSSRHLRTLALFSPRGFDAAQSAATKPLPLLQRRPRLGKSTPRCCYWRCCRSPRAPMAELLRPRR